MDKVELEKFKEALEAKREEIIRRAEQTLRQDMALDSDDFPDEMDLASSEYLQAFTFRLRGREKVFLTKIHQSITNTCITMRMVLHGLTDHIGNLIEAAIIHFFHCMKNAALNWL